MPDIPYSLASDNPKEFYDKLMTNLRDLLDNNIGGGLVGDVFKEDGGIFTLKIKEGVGLVKNEDNQLDFVLNARALSNTPSGGITSTNVQDAINELNGDKIGKDGSTDCRIGYVKIHLFQDSAVPPQDFIDYFIPNHDCFILYGKRYGPYLTGAGYPYTYITSLEVDLYFPEVGFIKGWTHSYYSN